MAAAGCHVQSHVAQQVKTGVEALVGIAFFQEFDNEGLALGGQLLLEFITDA
jgi:hypothetical protein